MQTKISITSALTIGVLLFIIPITSAAYGGSFGGNWGIYGSPLDILQNDWIMFIIIIAIFFAAIFYTVSKMIKNKGVAAIIAAGLSFLISMAIAQRGLIESYGGGEFSSWALFLAAAVGVAFLIRFSSESFGKIGTIITVFLVWLVLHSFYPEQLLPELLTNIPAFMWVWEWWITGWLGLIIFILLALAFGGNGPETIFESLSRMGNRRY